MPRPRIALIVGAGFSCEAKLPTTKELSEQFLECPTGGAVASQVEHEISKHLTKFWTDVFGYASGNPEPSLEDHFTAIDLAANTGHHLGPSYSPRKLRAIRRLSIHRAFQILDLKYGPSEAIESLLAELWKECKLSIVSVNWDVVVENHIHAMGRDYDYGASVKAMSGVADRRKPGAPLRKLHGSANWVYCDSCRTLFSGKPGAGKEVLRVGALLEPDDFEIFGSSRKVVKLVRELADGSRTCRICGCPMSARVGTFSYRKDYAIQQFQTIWHNAFDSPRESPVWIFIGYSMPEADFEFRQLLKSAELASRGQGRRQIQVVLKVDENAAGRYCRFFGIDKNCVTQGGLSQWVNEHLRDWLDRVEDSA